MARPPRCLVDDLTAKPVQLPAPSVHHLQHVLRLRPGDPVELIDGDGGLANARWKPGGELQPHAAQARVPAPPHGPSLFVAPPKGARLDGLVEKAVELGALEVRLLRTRYSGPLPSAARWDRMRRKADEALLQCRGLHRVKLGTPIDFADVIASKAAGILWFGSAPMQENTTGAANLPTSTPKNRLILLVGPEGGWAPDELSDLNMKGALPVSLGQRVLRVETAALALLVLAAACSQAPDPKAC